MHQQFSGSGKLLGQWLFWFFSKDSAKNGPKVKKGNRKIKNGDTKTGITQVLIEPQQMDQTVNFGYVPFLLKHKILKDCSNTDFVLQESQQNWPIFEEKGPRTPPPSPQPRKGLFRDAAMPWKHLKILNLTITNATLIRLTAII